MYNCPVSCHRIQVKTKKNTFISSRGFQSNLNFNVLITSISIVVVVVVLYCIVLYCIVVLRPR